jgi:hypothetical protein
MSPRHGRIPFLAITAWACAFSPVRSWDSLARNRTISRSSRTSGGAIHASANRAQAQQISQIPGVTLVVLHPPRVSVVALRVGQMHLHPQLPTDRPPSTTRRSLR